MKTLYFDYRDGEFRFFPSLKDRITFKGRPWMRVCDANEEFMRTQIETMLAKPEGEVDMEELGAGILRYYQLRDCLETDGASVPVECMISW